MPLKFAPAPDLVKIRADAVVELNKWFKIEPDKFTSTTTIKQKQPGKVRYTKEKRYGADQYGLDLNLIAITVDGKTPEHATLHIINLAREWYFLENSQTYILADGKSTDYGSPKVKGEVLKGADVLESFSLQIPAEDLRRYANAKKIELKIGIHAPLEITGQAQQPWKALAHYIDAARALEIQQEKTVSTK